MAHVLQTTDLIKPGAQTRTAKFEGENFEAGASFFYVDNDPGQGVGLHWHPYSETWVVVAGNVRFTIDGETVDGVAGTIATIPPEVHHGFVNSGPGALRMVCIHASPRIIQFDLEPPPIE